MIFECCAIILIIIIMAIMASRGTNHTGWGFALLPLLIVPAAHIIGIWFGGYIASLLGITDITAKIGIDLFSLVITCMFIGGISLKIKKKRLKIPYLVVCGLYSAILTCVLIVRSII